MEFKECEEYKDCSTVLESCHSPALSVRNIQQAVSQYGHIENWIDEKRQGSHKA